MAEMTMTTPTESPADRLRRRLPAIILHLLLLPGVALVAGPLIWMISSSFKDESAIFALPPQLIPWPVTLENYVLALGGDFPLTIGYVNSLKIAIITTAGTLLTSSLAAYALAKLEFRGRDTLFVADIECVRMFHRATGAYEGVLCLEGVTFLNDIAFGPEGSLFVTDSGLQSDPTGALVPSGTDAVFHTKIDSSRFSVSVVQASSPSRRKERE